MKKFSRIALVLTLCTSLAVSGCSATWVSTLDNILVAAAPALINILNIVAIAKGAVPNAALAAKINSDSAAIKTLANDFATASATASPIACAQLQTAINTYSEDQATVMSLVQISDPATLAKVQTLSALVSGTVTALLAAIPNCTQAAAMRASLAKSAVPLPLRSFVTSYNANLVVKTGNPAVDEYTASHKIHVHSGLVRVLTLGRAY